MGIGVCDVFVVGDTGNRLVLSFVKEVVTDRSRRLVCKVFSLSSVFSDRRLSPSNKYA